MNWLANLRRHLGYEDPSPAPPDEKEALEANAILANAKAAFNEAKTQQAEVQVVTASLASLRDRNHFGESIHFAMMPRSK